MTAADAPHQTYWANQARAAIAQAKAGLCGCGPNCTTHDQPTAPTPTDPNGASK